MNLIFLTTSKLFRVDSSSASLKHIERFLSASFHFFLHLFKHSTLLMAVLSSCDAILSFFFNLYPECMAKTRTAVPRGQWLSNVVLLFRRRVVSSSGEGNIRASQYCNNCSDFRVIIPLCQLHAHAHNCKFSTDIISHELRRLHLLLINT